VRKVVHDIAELVTGGLIVSSQHFDVETMPDGRQRITLARGILDRIAPHVIIEGTLEFDATIYPGTLYEVDTSSVPAAYTLKTFQVVNLGDAMNGISILHNGTPVTFTSGDTGGAPDPNSYPTATLDVPATGAFDFYCSIGIGAAETVEISTGTFGDPGVLFSGLFARFFYTSP